MNWIRYNVQIKLRLGQLGSVFPLLTCLQYQVVVSPLFSLLLLNNLIRLYSHDKPKEYIIYIGIYYIYRNILYIYIYIYIIYSLVRTISIHRSWGGQQGGAGKLSLSGLSGLTGKPRYLSILLLGNPQIQDDDSRFQGFQPVQKLRFPGTMYELGTYFFKSECIARYIIERYTQNS